MGPAALLVAEFPFVFDFHSFFDQIIPKVQPFMCYYRIVQASFYRALTFKNNISLNTDCSYFNHT